MELEPYGKITLASCVGTLADYTTTEIGLKYPELVEANPHVNFINELLATNISGNCIYALAKMLKQSDELSLAFGLMPAAVPFAVAIHNLAWIAWVHRKQYPWEECPILYPE